MVYDTFIHNKRELDYIFARKLFKKHIFHNDNIEEEYYWDDYDTTIPQAPTLPVCKHVTIKQRHIPKITKHPINLHNTSVKIFSNNSSNVSTQTDASVSDGTSQTTNPSTCDNTSQTFPKFYFPGTRSNFKFEPFNTNIIF